MKRPTVMVKVRRPDGTQNNTRDQTCQRRAPLQESDVNTPAVQTSERTDCRPFGGEGISAAEELSWLDTSALASWRAGLCGAAAGG
jgi:hypothetical protein